MKLSLTVLPLLVACGGAAAADGTESVEPSEAVVQGSPLDMYGPYPDDHTILRQCQLGAGGRVLAEQRAPGGQVVALREFRAVPSSGHCAVTIQTTAGSFVGPSFLCSADQAEAEIGTLHPAVATTAAEATVRFTIQYQQVIDQLRRAMTKRRPSANDYIVLCTLEGPRPKCTLPPRIGVYDFGRCGR